MLNAIRKKTGSLVVKILLVFLVISFGAWGIGDMVQGRMFSSAVATVDDREISAHRFANELQREVNRLRRFIGNTATLETIRELGLDMNLLNRLVRTELLSAAAESHGLVVSDAQVSNEIRIMPAFAGITGGFDYDTFRQAIANAGYTENDFIQLVREEMKQQLILDSLASGSYAPDALAERIYAYRNETRSASFATIPDSLFPDVARPTETEIAAYHQDNQNRFMAPEYRDVTYIYLTVADLVDNIDVSETDIEDAYASREDEFTTPARRNVDQAIFDSEEDARAARDLVAGGVVFADAVSQIKGSPVGDLSLGWVTPSDLLGEDTVRAVFDAEAGEITGPVKSPLGWLLFNVVDAEYATRETLDQVRDTLRDDVALGQALDELFELANELEDLLAAGLTFEEAGEQMDIIVHSIPSLSEGGEDDNGNSVANLPGQEFLSTVFATPDGEESPLIESGEDAYFIIRVNSVTDPVLRPLSDVRNDVIAAILADRRSEKAEETANSLAAKLNTGSDLSALAAESGAVVSRADSIYRNGQGLPADMPQSVATALFEAIPGAGVVVRGHNGYIIGHLTGITSANIDKAGSDYQSLKSSLAQGMQQDLVDQLSAALQLRYPVSINESAMSNAYGTY